MLQIIVIGFLNGNWKIEEGKSKVISLKKRANLVVVATKALEGIFWLRVNLFMYGFENMKKKICKLRLGRNFIKLFMFTAAIFLLVNIFFFYIHTIRLNKTKKSNNDL